MVGRAVSASIAVRSCSPDRKAFARWRMAHSFGELSAKHHLGMLDESNMAIVGMRATKPGRSLDFRAIATRLDGGMRFLLNSDKADQRIIEALVRNESLTRTPAGNWFTK